MTDFSSWRGSFRTWRGQRPFWAGLLTLLGGLPIMYFPYAHLTLGQLTVRMATADRFRLVDHRRADGRAGLHRVVPVHRTGLRRGRHDPARPGLRSSVSNLGGFLVGFLLALIGGGMALSWSPGRPANGLAMPVGEPAVAGIGVDDESTNGRHQCRVTRLGPRFRAARPQLRTGRGTRPRASHCSPACTYPAGKAIALAAMPTAVLMGMGLTRRLAQAAEPTPLQRPLRRRTTAVAGRLVVGEPVEFAGRARAVRSSRLAAPRRTAKAKIEPDREPSKSASRRDKTITTDPRARFRLSVVDHLGPLTGSGSGPRPAPTASPKPSATPSRQRPPTAAEAGHSAAVGGLAKTLGDAVKAPPTAFQGRRFVTFADPVRHRAANSMPDARRQRWPTPGWTNASLPAQPGPGSCRATSST